MVWYTSLVSVRTRRVWSLYLLSGTFVVMCMLMVFDFFAFSSVLVYNAALPWSQLSTGTLIST